MEEEKPGTALSPYDRTGSHRMETDSPPVYSEHPSAPPMPGAAGWRHDGVVSGGSAAAQPPPVYTSLASQTPGAAGRAAVLMQSGESAGGMAGDSSNASRDDYRSLLRACAAEFIGTLVLALISITGTCGFGASETLTGNNAPVILGLILGLTYFLLICMTSSASGGHLNPAMSLGVWLAGSMNVLRFRRFILYAFCQFVGATIGAAMALGLNNKDLLYEMRYTTSVFSRHYQKGQVFGIEMFLVFVLVTTFLVNMIDDNGFKDIAPLSVGMVVALGTMATTTIARAYLNPALSFGASITSLYSIDHESWEPGDPSYYDTYWRYQWIFHVGPFLGGVLAAVNYRVLLKSRGVRLPRTE
ncbi:aquaporin-like [Sycon ciliatum]|uniref:aquaporin-like n=1 Tax=Sycon ciliatum TaxID=27933 RepID=UPI0031F5FB57